MAVFGIGTFSNKSYSNHIRNKWVLGLTLLVLLTVFLTHTTIAQGVVPDANLADEIRRSLGLPQNSPLTPQDLQGLFILFVFAAEITDLTGMEHAINLNILHLIANDISDITPLTKLTNLTQLRLGSNDISDITPLAKLTQLRLLGLYGNDISDITPLTKLTNLTQLDLSINDISDITPLTKLTNLTQLDLSIHNINDITPLTKLTNLTQLDLGGYGGDISDITPLVKLTQLRLLDLSHNEINDITPLAKLTNLTQLNLYANDINDITPLAKLTNLTQLDLGGNEISDLSPLAKLTNLKELSLWSNEISDLSPLAGLRQLEELQVRGNPIADITSLQSLLRKNPNLKVDVQPVPGLMPDANLAAEVRGQLRLELGSPLTKQDLNRLTSLYADSLGITDLTGLEHATQLKRLYLSRNEISDITPLAKLTKLEILNLSSNEISDITPLTKLTNLTQLHLSSNEISDINPLTKLTKLEILNLKGNEISDTGPIRQLLQRNPNLKLDIHPDAGPTIEGPWVWMIAPTDQKSDGKAAASEEDWLKAASKGRVTEQQIAMNGALPGDIVGDKVWTLGKITLTDDRNITSMVNAIGLGTGDTIKNHVAYGSIALHSPRKQNTGMYIWNSYGVKVWLNGVLVHNNPVGSGRYIDYQQDVPRVTLKQGKNILLVAFYNKSEFGSYGFFAFKNDAVYSLSITPTVHISEAQRPPMYWVATNAGTLHRLIGDEVEDMLPNVQNVTSLAVDSAVGSLYWTEKTGKRTGKIKRANLDGSNIKLIKDLTSVPLNIALDSAARKLYLINAYGKIQRLNLDGSNFQSNLITNLKSPNYLTLDVTGGKIYWTEQTGNTTGKIQRANLDGTNVELLKELTSVPHGLTIDPGNNKLYLTNAYGKIQRLNLDGSNFQPNLITDLDAPQSLAVDSVGGKVYWIEQGSIRRANLNGKKVQNVVSGLSAPANIVLGSVPAATAAAPARVEEIPTQTAMLANYPNPFNPETWIPYQLAESSDVKITIYNTHGVVVRQLELGHQPAGIYTSRSRATYWDGRNSQGERVASGIYFYQLQADNVSSLRKMLILK
ncbi:MAG: leucine-rich repeat domain-containing protein [Candidatus Poribacteria bacterium]|nr:leucine-rich repeat domain-containing protein [Candidatus Poribacteria bacterium]